MTDAGQSDPSVVRSIAEHIKDPIAGLTRDRVAELVRQHLLQFRFIDGEGRWQAEELAAIGDWLLGEDLDTHDALELVDEAARCAEANPYLVEFLNRAGAEPSERLRHEVRTQGAVILPSVAQM